MVNFQNGRPVRPDVEKLVGAFNLMIGDKITHQQIETVIGEERGSTRYQGVVESWKRRMWREHKYQIESEHGVGYHVLTADRAVTSAVGKMKRVTKASRKLGSRVNAIDTRNMAPDRQQLVSVVSRYTDAVGNAYRTARKEIATPTPVSAPPLRLAKIQFGKS